MRIHERDLAIPALRAASEQPNGYISTTDLIEHLEEYFQPEGEDAKILEGRHDSKFSQIVRNLVSHRGGQNTIFAKGYAEYVEEGKGIQITEKGRLFIAQVPE
jgi:hypothetical protein